MIAPPLTHRFTVLYENGTTFAQPDDDKSRTRERGSAFSDVDRDRVVVFFLESGRDDDDPAKHLYSVDLRDGHFAIDGVEFFLGPDNDVPQGGRRRLLYFRRNWQQQTIDARNGDVRNRTMRRAYHFGYEILDMSGNIVRQHTVEVGHEIHGVDD